MPRHHYLYETYWSMIKRCYNKNHQSYKYYGGRGITVCDRWINSFQAFLQDMGDRPKGLTLDRINNNLSYSPENCRWATRKQQMQNRNVAVIINIEGEFYYAYELSEKYNIRTDIIIKRADKGLSFDQVISKKKLYNPKGIKIAIQAAALKKNLMTHCKNNHEFTEQNTYVSKKGYRTCRKCKAINRSKRRLKSKQSTSSL